MKTTNITKLIEDSQFQQAFELIVLELKSHPNNAEFLELSKVLSACVRGRCMELASNKATEMSLEAYATEALLKEIIKLNGESIYG